MLTDESIITVKAGKGGDGIASFRREKYIPKGGPDGGDGGRGGSVFFIVDGSTHALSEFARQKYFEAKKGMPGQTAKKTGKSAEDLYLRVPPGTLVKQDGFTVADLTEIGQQLKIARGGKGGLGNVHFSSSTHQTPQEFTKGEPGEEKTIKLELKLLADVGLIGFPNAGKSTLISHISNARPKIADYPFTTLEPNLGMVRYRDRSIVFADVPGLIEGASHGKGLGERFLKHVERTRVLVHLIDINESDPTKAYNVIREELGNWNKSLLEKIEIVVLNKADTVLPKEAEKIVKKLSKNIKKDVILISAVSGQGIDTLLDQVVKVF